MDELEKTHPADQLNELENSGPRIMGMAATFSAYLNHQENGGTHETFMGKKDGLFDASDDFVKTFMKMAIDTESQEDPRLHKTLNIYFDLLIGHGMNLSTSVLIQTASGSGHVANSIVAAFNALNSDNHGRAALKAHEMFRHIKSNYNGNVTDFIKAIKEKRETLWGHGHATYKKGTDPRAEIDEILARTLLNITSDQELKEDIMLALNLKEEALKQGLGWQTNVDYFASLILRGCKISPKLSTVMFATSRLGSWLADLHQFGLEKHPLMRPQDKPFDQNPLLRNLDEF
jgi:citrate synthase